MNTFLKYSSSALLLGLGLFGCQPEMHSPKYDRGTADFSRYIAVGNSLTAGFSDGGLYLEGQNSSYPFLLSQQFVRVGGGQFVQPLFTDAQPNGSGYLRLTGFTPATPTALPSPITASVTNALAVRGAVATRTNPAPNLQPIYTKFLDPINNLGVPGIRMSDIETPGFGNVASTGGTLTAPTPIFNPYFERITPDGSNVTYRQRVAASNPTFFTFWLGNNDVLGYATAGGAASSITPTATFTTLASNILDDLTANGAKGVVGLIPNVANVPFFTTVGPSFRANLALNSVPSAAPFVYTTGTLAPGQLNTRVSTNLASIRDASGTGDLLLTLTASPYLSLYGRPGGKYWRDFYQQARPSIPTALIPNLSAFLTAMSIDTTKNFGQDNGNPFPSTLVLDPTEQTAVSTATTEFNNALRAKANAKGLAIFDSNSFFAGVAQSGFIANGVNNTASFITGNLFSLDGVHPTPRGYAVVANEMIKVINAKYGSTIPLVNPNAYRGVRIP